jgi:hypothetical protein
MVIQESCSGNNALIPPRYFRRFKIHGMKRLTIALVLLTIASAIRAQVLVTALNTAYTQNFNGLKDTGLNNPYSGLPSGWFAQEIGTGANTLYRAAWGQLAGGDLYSFGDSAVAERALGSLGSGSVAPVFFGVALINNTSTTVQRVRLAYRGEVWRVGNAARTTGPDTLHLGWGRNNKTISTGSFTRYPKLSFVSPVPSTHTQEVAVNGNSSAYVGNVADTLNALGLAPGDTLWLQWSDYNSSSFDDGMGIDDLSITFLSTTTPPAVSSRFLSIDTFNRYYRQDFDSLSSGYAATASFSTLPRGWFAHETGSGADATYRASYGEYAGGNIYSWGDSLGSERALGSIGSGSVTRSDYGSAWINKTGSIVDNIEITFMGEQWRQGRPGRAAGPDTLHFSYAKNALSIDSGNYVTAPAMSFHAPVTNGVLSTPMNGNLPANRTRVNGIISNLGLRPNDTLWIRWSDFDSESFDDGLGIDSFSLAAVSTPALLTMAFKDANTAVREESGQVRIPVRIFNKSAFLSQADVFLADRGTVDTVTDIRLSSSYVSFPGNRSDTLAWFTFNMINSEPFENTEYFVLGLRNPRNGQIGAIRYDTVRIINYQYPQAPLAALSGEDTQGFPDSLGRTFVVEGTVHGVNYSLSGGLDFYVMDSTGGINIYQPGMSRYRPVSGDKLRIWGAIGQFRGLTRMESLDSVQVLSSGNALRAPRLVRAPKESDESVLIRMDSLRLSPQVASWPSNLEVQAITADNRDTLRIFISSETDLAGMAAPRGYFDLTGIGSQFNTRTNPPFNNGYRVMAISRLYTMPTGITSSADNEFRLYPNPVSSRLHIQAPDNIVSYAVTSMEGRVISAGTGFGRALQLNTESWIPGLYGLRIKTGNQIIIRKIVKQ